MYFTTCKTMDEAKHLYRELAKRLHPDHGGDAEAFKAMADEYDRFNAGAWNRAYTAYSSTAGIHPNANTDLFEAMIKRTVHLATEANATVEIIGYWIYVFDGYSIRETLKGLGFWFSSKHKAWVFSGSAKHKTHTRLTTDDIRSLHGSEILTEKRDRARIA